MESIAQFFARLNDVEFQYVVLRNWENLPNDVQFGAHGDLDLLVYDQEHFEEIIPSAKRVYEKPRVQYRIPIGNTFVQADIRYLGDSYYPYDFEKAMLKNRVYNHNGFWTPDPIHHRIALAYHAVHHKGRIAVEYKRWLGDVTIEAVAEALKKSNIGWEKPEDHTVGTFFSYVKGATGVVSKYDGKVRKTQYRFKEHDLLKNEVEMIGKVSGRHFPYVSSASTDEIEIEDCGEELNSGNIPDDWKEQLREILVELKRADVVHRDIRIDNIMVKDGVLKLIDFGWATSSANKNMKAPDLLGYPNKAPWGFDDAYSMGKVFKQIEGKLEGIVR